MQLPRILAIILAGGKGSRLGALTDDRVKPSLPVAGTYRLVDVSLSNLMHSHVRDVWIVEQYLPHSLNTHLANGRPWDLDRSHGGLKLLPPFEGAQGEGFTRGNSDALFRNRRLIEAFGADLVLVLSADHLYTANFLDVVATHTEQRADLTLVTTEVAGDASRYGVVQVADGLVTGYAHKPDRPEGNLVSAEMFLFDADRLLEALEVLHAERGGLTDHGEDLLPWFVENAHVAEHRHAGYWADLGTIASYWAANLQVLDGTGARLDDPAWPILSAQPQLVPARIAAAADVRDALVAAGAQVAGTVAHSVLGPNVVVEQGATVRDSVLLDGVRVRSGAVLDHTVVDLGADVAPGTYGDPGTVTLLDASGAVSETVELEE